MALLLGLTPEGSLREELGYGLGVSARLDCDAVNCLYCAPLATAYWRRSLVTATSALLRSGSCANSHEAFWLHCRVIHAY